MSDVNCSVNYKYSIKKVHNKKVKNSEKVSSDTALNYFNKNSLPNSNQKYEEYEIYSNNFKIKAEFEFKDIKSEPISILKNNFPGFTSFFEVITNQKEGRILQDAISSMSQNLIISIFLDVRKLLLNY